MVGGAQDFVAAYDFAEAGFQHPGVQSAPETYRPRNVVNGSAWLQLVHEPKLLLREGHGEHVTRSNAGNSPVHGSVFSCNIVMPRDFHDGGFVCRSSTLGRVPAFAKRLHYNLPP